MDRGWLVGFVQGFVTYEPGSKLLAGGLHTDYIRTLWRILLNCMYIRSFDHGSYHMTCAGVECVSQCSRAPIRLVQGCMRLSGNLKGPRGVSPSYKSLHYHGRSLIECSTKAIEKCSGGRDGGDKLF